MRNVNEMSNASCFLYLALVQRTVNSTSLSISFTLHNLVQFIRSIFAVVVQVFFTLRLGSHHSCQKLAQGNT